MKTHIAHKLLKRALLSSIFIGCLLSSTSLTFAQPRDWQAQRTWVFIVGILKWKHADTFQSFPQLNRRDAQLATFFRQQGVPSNQLISLQDQQATIGQVRREFSDLLSRTKAGDFLVVYFTGHGYKSEDERTTFFATYDAGDNVSGWSTKSIVSDINWGFRGSRVLLTADCCFSGALANDARRLDPRLAYACLTSATSDEVSTENWTFTEMLLAGWRGKSYADVDGDGQVTLGEIADNENRDMAFAEEQRTAFVQRGFSPKTVLALATTPANATIGERVVVRSEGDLYKARVIDARGARLRVHYYGFEDSDDEWVLARQIRGNERTSGRNGGWSDGWIGRHYADSANQNRWQPQSSTWK